MPDLHDVSPREVAGRDMTLRVSMQHQAAAYAALEVLERGEVDRVYCDYHDDFVVRRTSGGFRQFHFFQVKTKAKLSHQWSVAEILAINSKQHSAEPKSLRDIQKSFIGRLIGLSLTFGDSCRAVTLLSNVYFHDKAVQAVQELSASSPKNTASKFLQTNFCKIFEVGIDDEAARKAMGKLTLDQGVKYIGDEQRDFAVAARAAIHKFSEIDLEHHETAEIAAGLVALVNRKSLTPICDVAPDALDDLVGVGLADLLPLLSISAQAYEALRAGADPKALKTASFIQRKLKAAGASDSMIEFASHNKVAWDIWMREARHTHTEFDLNFLLQHMDALRTSWMVAGGGIEAVQQVVEDEFVSKKITKFSTLTKDLVFGGVIAAYVRRGTA